MQPTQQTSAAEVPSKPAAELIAHESPKERAQAMERDGFVFFPRFLVPNRFKNCANVLIASKLLQHRDGISSIPTAAGLKPSRMRLTEIRSILNS